MLQNVTMIITYHYFYFQAQHQPPDNNFRASTDAWTPSIIAASAMTIIFTWLDYGFHGWVTIEMVQLHSKAVRLTFTRITGTEAIYLVPLGTSIFNDTSRCSYW